MTFNVDLVAEQIHIAAGQPLSLNQETLSSSGHAIECRICAEDAFNDFMPATGKVLFLKEPCGQGVRFDSGLYLNQAITSAFDPMLAKLIVHAPTRQQAIEAMRQALQELVILGVKHNIDYLDTVLRHQQFIEGHFDTGFIKQYDHELTPLQPDKQQQQAILATALLSERSNRLLAEATPDLHAAIGHWRN